MLGLKVPKRRDSGIERVAIVKPLSPPTYFLRWADASEVFILPKPALARESDKAAAASFSPAIVPAQMEDEFSKHFDLINKSQWKVYGERYLIGKCVISSGLVQHGSEILKGVIELIYYADGEDESVDIAICMTGLIEEVFSSLQQCKYHAQSSIVLLKNEIVRSVQWIEII